MSAPTATTGVDPRERAAAGGAGLRAIARLAVRSIRRDRRRSLLIVALLAVPVALAIVVAAGQRAIILTPEQQQEQLYGQAVVTIEGDLSGVTNLFIDGEPSPEAASVADEFGIDLATLENLATTAATLTSADVAAAVAAETNGTPIAPYVRSNGFGIGRDYVDVLGLDADDPLAEGIVTLDAGRAPAAGEAALTPRAVELLDAGIGDTVEIPGLGSVVVSGLFRQNNWVDASAVLVPPASIEALGWTTWLIGPWTGTTVDDAFMLADRVSERLFADDAEVIGRLGGLYSQRSTDSFGYDEDTLLQLDRPPVLAGFVTAGLLLIVALIAAAAFATGARRRVREFGLMATIGAEPGHIRRLVLIEAVLLGAVGVVVGIAVGVVGAEGATPLIERLADHVVDDVGASWADIVAPALVGVAGALAAAWYPARSISRVPVLSALNGRVPQRALRARVVPVAAVLLTMGLVLIGAAAGSLATSDSNGDVQVLVMIVGCILCLGAAALGATWVSGLIARHAERLPLGARLVARDAGRQRFRTAVSVAGLVVILAAPVMVMSAAITAENAGRSTHQAAARADEVVLGIASPWTDTRSESATTAPIDPDVITRAEAALDAIVPVTAAGSVSGLMPATQAGDAQASAEGAVWANVLRAPASDGQEEWAAFDSGWVGVGTPEAVAALRLPPAAAELLAAGTAVTTASLSGSTTAQVEWCEAGYDAQCELYDVEVTGFGGRERTWSEPSVLVPPSMAEELGLVPVVGSELVLFVADEPLTSGQRDAIDDAVTIDFQSGASSFADVTGADIRVSTHDPFQGFVGLIAAIALPATLAVVLVLGGCLVAIAATESDRDIATMVRVGAAPALRRRFSGLQGWYHAVLGAALGAPVGLLVLVALRNAVENPPPFTLPWTTLGVVVVGIPIVLGLVVVIVTRSASGAAQ